jgi:hypothetical protein
MAVAKPVMEIQQENEDESVSKRRRVDVSERLSSRDLVCESRAEEAQDAATDNLSAQVIDSTVDDDHDAPWTINRLMRTFQTSQEIQQYVERSQDESLIRFLETLQQVGRFSTNPSRKKLQGVNDLVDVSRLLRASQNILILTGAGVSVSAGIPDFRSADGIYARLKREFNMPSPTCMFDIDYFNTNPGTFFNFASELWPGRFKPSKSHLFMADLERRGKLLRNYTQNIDTLEQQAGQANNSTLSFVSTTVY